jgi:hypothetical protein
MLELSSEEADLVVTEASAAAGVLEGPRKEQALDLVREARTGEISDDLLTTLERILAASLQGGRARHLYKAEGEGLLTRLLLRTPGGQRLQKDLDAVNQALRSLRGRQLDEVRVAMRTPGHFTLSLQTEGVGLVLVVRPDGVAVESLTA